jgi:hypothetical protein
VSITQESALKIIYQALANLNEERDGRAQVPLAPETALFGRSSLLDSLALVSVIVDVESALSDELGVPICLTGEDALNREESPFADVRSLCAFIVQLTGGRS